MDMQKMESLSNNVCRNLEYYSNMQDYTAQELDNMKDLAMTLYYLLKSAKLKGRMMDETSQRSGSWEGEMRGEYGNSYDGGYANGHYVRGHYSRDGDPSGGMSNRGGSYRGYSRDGYSNASIVKKLQEIVGNAEGREREILERCIEDMR